MRVTLFIFLFAISFPVLAQDKYIFDTSKVDATTVLIGRYPQFDTMKTNKEYNFIITDPATIKTIIMEMALVKESERTIAAGEPTFRINVVQNYKEVKTWFVSPKKRGVMYGGHTFEFDIEKLKSLAKKYPLEYKFDRIPFNLETDYEKYLEAQKRDSSFLFYYAPSFNYDGRFEIQFPRNEKFSSPKAISEYLTPLIEKIAAKGEYVISYVLNEKNIRNRNQYTMTIDGSKMLFNDLQVKNLKNENWVDAKHEGWFFYRTK